MTCLAETQPKLVKAASEALKKVEPSGPESAREATFTFEGDEYWTKMTIDGHANCIERWDIFPADQPRW